MRQFFKLGYFQLDWLFLFFLSLLVRLIGINYGLPFEHYPDEEYHFGNVDNTLASGKLYPGIFNYGYLFYYLLHFTSSLARTVIDSSYIREYEILFSRIVIVVIASITPILIYEISRRIQKDRLMSLLASGIYAFSLGSVILSRFVMVDNLMALLLLAMVLAAVIFLKTKSKISLLLMFIFSGIAVSPKLSYALFIFYPVFIYFLSENFKLSKKILMSVVKFFAVSVFFYGLGNFFEIFHLYSWIGRNLYFIKAYNTLDYFYFKDLHSNYFEHLLIILQFMFADFLTVTDFTSLIAILILLIFIFKSKLLFKKDKKIYLAIITFPLLFMLLVARTKVFQTRTFLPIEGFFFLILGYPAFKKSLLKTAETIIILILMIILFWNSYSAMLSVAENNAEAKTMSFVNNTKAKFAMPNVFKYPSIEYAYWKPEMPLDLLSYPFFILNKDKIYFYHSDEELISLTGKVDYIIIQKQLLQELDYKKYNALRSEPFFEAVDLRSENDLKNILIQKKFKLIANYNTSSYETIQKYDSANLGLKQIYIYKK